jgi:hypothetical protein
MEAADRMSALDAFFFFTEEDGVNADFRAAG